MTASENMKMESQNGEIGRMSKIAFGDRVFSKNEDKPPKKPPKKPAKESKIPSKPRKKFTLDGSYNGIFVIMSFVMALIIIQGVMVIYVMDTTAKRNETILLAQLVEIERKLANAEKQIASLMDEKTSAPEEFAKSNEKTIQEQALASKAIILESRPISPSEISKEEAAELAAFVSDPPVLEIIKSKAPDETGAKLFYESAKEYGELMYVLIAVAEKESMFNPDATNGPYIGMGQFNTNIWSSWFLNNDYIDSRRQITTYEHSAKLIAAAMEGSCPACTSLEERLARYNGGSNPPPAAWRYAGEILDRADELRSLDGVG